MKAKKAYALAATAALLSICTGALYVASLMFDYGFLGPEIGSERETVRFWGIVSIGLGVVLLAAVMSAMNTVLRWSKVVLLFVLFIMCVIQLPPLAMWLFVILLGYGGAAPAVLLHVMLLGLLIGCARLLRRALVVP